MGEKLHIFTKYQFFSHHLNFSKPNIFCHFCFLWEKIFVENIYTQKNMMKIFWWIITQNDKKIWIQFWKYVFFDIFLEISLWFRIFQFDFFCHFWLLCKKKFFPWTLYKKKSSKKVLVYLNHKWQKNRA